MSEKQNRGRCVGEITRRDRWNGRGNVKKEIREARRKRLERWIRRRKETEMKDWRYEEKQGDSERAGVGNKEDDRGDGGKIFLAMQSDVKATKSLKKS